MKLFSGRTMLGIIGGTSVFFSSFTGVEKKIIATPYGRSEVFLGPYAFIMRHQWGLPPHRINVRAHIAALTLAGVDRIVSIGSSGSLKREIHPGSLLIPDDYITVADVPSFFDHEIEHVRPELSIPLRRDLARAIPKAYQKGCYVQTRGPRIETVSEVRALAPFADIVGMTLASEATLACEMEIPFAAVCTVDNYANGLGDEVLTYEGIREHARLNQERTDAMLATIIETLG